MPNPTVLSDLTYRQQGEDVTAGSVGGELVRLIAGAALLVGDNVYVSGVNTVNKSATAANYLNFAGFVETGEALSMETGFPVGTAAASTGQHVLVRRSGIARAIVGATGFTAGTDLAVPSAATAGRIIPGTTADQRLGVALTTQATAGSEVRILIHHK